MAALDPAPGTSTGTTTVGGSPPLKKSCHHKKGKPASAKSRTLKLGEVDPADVLPASRLVPPPMDVIESASQKSVHILGTKPSKVPAYANVTLSEWSKIFFGCDTISQYLQLLEYLQLNGEYQPVQVQCRGACQYASFCWSIDCPMEYTNTHLRRQLVMEIIRHKEFFLPILEDRITMNYGAIHLSAEEYKAKCTDGTITEDEREVYNEPGPFSFRTFLEHILQCSSWGDEITLVLLSMIFQVWITTIETHMLRSNQVCHSNRLEEADIVMLLAHGNHYMPTGKNCCICLIPTVSFISICYHYPVLVLFQFLQMCCSLHFSVCQVEEGDSITLDVLAVNPLIKHPGYHLDLDDLGIYSDDEDYVEGVKLQWEWPHHSLLKVTEIPEVSEEHALLIKRTLKAHHFNAWLLESLRVNACKQYKLTKADTVLKVVKKGDSSCRICGKKGFSTSHTL